jgi:hypothetical protein
MNAFAYCSQFKLEGGDENFKHNPYVLGEHHPTVTLGSLIGHSNGGVGVGNALMSTPPRPNNRLMNKGGFPHGGYNSTTNNKPKGGMFTCTPKNEAFQILKEEAGFKRFNMLNQNNTPPS